MVPTLRTEADIRAFILSDPWRKSVLDAAASLRLPDWAVGAGFVRNPVWDALMGRDMPTPVADVDVLYFDPSGITRESERAREAQLHRLMPEVPWSVKNQARMHRRNSDRPYRDTLDGIRHWLETPTAVAIRLTEGGEAELLAPFGIGDLLGMVIRPTPSGQRRRDAYVERIRAKRLAERWPGVGIEWPSTA